MIGTVGSADKGKLAKKHGCASRHQLLDRGFRGARRMRSPRAAKCDVVYDGVGKATFPGSLDCLKPFGTFVSFGSASGPVEAFDIGLLAKKGSLYATRPTLFTHIADREDLCSHGEPAVRGGAATGTLTIAGNHALSARKSRRCASRARGPADDRLDDPACP